MKADSSSSTKPNFTIIAVSILAIAVLIGSVSAVTILLSEGAQRDAIIQKQTKELIKVKNEHRYTNFKLTVSRGSVENLNHVVGWYRDQLDIAQRKIETTTAKELDSPSPEIHIRATLPAILLVPFPVFINPPEPVEPEVVTRDKDEPNLL